MTQEQFNKASKLQIDINILKDRNEQLKKIINLLKENINKGYTRPNIRIEIDDVWIPTKGIIDSYDLLNFLNQQRIKNETKIEEMNEEFEKI